jgi:citronellol/citronellal dehydrogenase
MNTPNAYFLPNTLQDQVILVTGGGSGIGYAIAELCLSLGATVLIASRNEAKLQAAQGQLQALGPCAYAICDIRDIAQIEALAQRIQAEYGRLDALVNNAGGQFPSLAEDISHKGWNAVVNNNLNGTWYCTQIMAKQFFIPQQKGKVLNIIANIYRGFAGMAHTGAARAGVDNLTKSLAVEWSKYNIQVNAIAPGIIASSGLENYPPELLLGITEKIPAGRLGQPSEVAQLAGFVLSPMAQYMTGATLYLDGGQHLWGDLFALR